MHATPKETAAALQAYQLPDHVLSMARQRHPFQQYAQPTLQQAIAFVQNHPESRGILPYAIRTLTGQKQPTPLTEKITIEAHIDATQIPPTISDQIIALGFSPDPFVQFNPAHFSDHFTLKFHCAATETTQRKHTLMQTITQHCEAAFALLNQSPAIEAYIELETYHSRNRRQWHDMPLSNNWQAESPLAANTLHTITPPRTAQEAAVTGVSLAAVKHADIHIKLAPPTADTATLIARFCNNGFYHVITGSGNNVLTAQFAHMQDAKAIFKPLISFFEKNGGCAEITLEPVRKLWRTEQQDATGTIYASLPPLVLSCL